MKSNFWASPAIFLIFIPFLSLNNAFAQSKGTWKAQWVNEDTTTVEQLSVINDKVCWATTINYGWNDSFWVHNPSPIVSFYKTIDGGKTWEKGIFEWQNQSHYFKIFGLSDKVAWGISANAAKVFQTIDGGKTWQLVPTPYVENKSFINDIYFWNPAIGIMIGDPRDGYFEIYKTYNGGLAWNKIPSYFIPPSLPEEIGHMGAFAYCGNSILFATGTNINSRVYVSHNAGENWFVTNPGIKNIFRLSLGTNGFVIVMGWTWNKSTNQFNDTQFKISRDSGRTWKDLEIDPSKKPIGACFDVKIIPPSNYIIASFRSSNGVTQPESAKFATYISKDLGKTWEKMSDVAPYCIDFSSPSNIWGGMADIHHQTHSSKIVKYEGLPLVAMDSAEQAKALVNLLEMNETVEKEQKKRQGTGIIIGLLAIFLSLWFLFFLKKKKQEQTGISEPVADSESTKDTPQYREDEKDNFKVQQNDIINLLNQMKSERYEPKLSVATTEGIRLLPMIQIMRIEGDRGSSIIHIHQAKRVVSSKSLAHFEALLPSKHFIRIHKSNIVNIDFIERYVRGEGGSVFLTDGTELSVSRDMKQNLLNALKIN